MKIEWLTTGANPKRGLASPVGWKCHAVWANDSFVEIKNKAAVCGQRAKFGWDTDLFIVDKCAKCCAKLNIGFRKSLRTKY